MKSLWRDEAAAAAVAGYAADGIGEDLALRTYSARLLGADTSLVLHGGGNTSVKTLATDVFGASVPVLCVKGSGWDLATIEPEGHPAVRLEPLLQLRQLPRLSDEAMVNAQRQNLMDTSAPNPSVETLLHAFIGAKFIDHTHALSVLALANQPDASEVLMRVYGARVALVPYVMPGFDLAKSAAEIWQARPGIEGLVLLNHGIFSFGATAKQSYERMIDLVTVAELYIARQSRAEPSVARLRGTSLDVTLPILRGLLHEAAGDLWPGRWVMDMRNHGPAAQIAGEAQLSDLARLGVATPDHVIRTKRQPLVLPLADGDLGIWRTTVKVCLADFISEYDAYFRTNAARAGGGKTQLDPLPRVLALRGHGLVGLGRSAGDAAIAADIAESWAATLLQAQAVGRFAPLGEADTFDMEYWSLEQAKLSKAAEPRLARHVVVVTGGAGTIGLATAKAFAAEGAEVALLDLDADITAAAARAIGRHALGLACDVTDRHSVEAAFARVCSRFGGVDIVVSNAGAATRGMMEKIDDARLKSSFDLNFFAHQTVAQAAVRVMQAQGFGGALLFNVSKQALNPGPDFGAYGTAKAALLALVRQYAIEHGADGIRANAINADRIRSGLLTDEMVASRAAARGTDEAAYLAGNLLKREVRAEDVAQAFVFAAMMQATTGAVITVDGGNVAAMVR